MKTISIEELEAFFAKVLNKLADESVESVKIPNDFYRVIPADKWASYEDGIIQVGSLDDDIASLKMLLEDSERPTTYLDFDRLASVLHAISQELNPPAQLPEGSGG